MTVEVTSFFAAHPEYMLLYAMIGMTPAALSGLIAGLLHQSNVLLGRTGPDLIQWGAITLLISYVWFAYLVGLGGVANVFLLGMWGSLVPFAAGITTGKLGFVIFCYVYRRFPRWFK